MTVPLRYLDTTTAASLLDSLYPEAGIGGTRVVTYGQQPKTNTLILYGPADEAKKAAVALRRADRDPSHIIIEALIVEFDADALDQLAIDISKLSAGPYSNIATSFGSLLGNSLGFTYVPGANNKLQLSAFINALVSTNRARLIARPYVATLSGETATIDISRNRYVVVQAPQNGATITTTNAVTSGVIMKITPTVLSDEMIRMDVDVEDSQFIPTEQNIAVEVDKNSAQTVMRVTSGQTIIIGGLVLNRKTRGNTGVPWLRHLPPANLLFADQEFSRQKQEVFIYLTPRIWTPDVEAPLVLPESFTIHPKDEHLSDLERKLLNR